MKRMLFLALCVSLYAIACSTVTQEKKGTIEIKWLTTQGKLIVNKDGGEKRILKGVNVSGMEYDSTGKRVPIRDLMALANN
jgi:hypothetical protein